MKKNKNIYNGNNKLLYMIDKLTLVIAVIAIALVPLLIRVNALPNPLNVYNWYSGSDVFFDNYSKIKSEVILFLGISSFILIIIKQIKSKSYKLKDPVLVMTLIFAMVTIISQFISISATISNDGFLGRYESTWVWLSYFSIFILVYGTQWKKEAFQKLMWFFVGSNLILSIIGVLQYLGFDPVFNDFTKFFITDASMKGIEYNADYTINYKVIVQTLYHYNYVGFYLSLSLPVIMSLALYEKKRLMQMGYLALIMLMLFNLLGSTARGGLVAVAVILPLFIIFNRQHIFKNTKQFLVASAILLVVFIGFEVVSGGFVSMRLKSIFTSVETANLVSDIKVEDDKITYTLTTGNLEITPLTPDKTSWDPTFVFNGTSINYLVDDANTYYYFSEPELKGIKITYSKLNEALLLQIDTYGQVWHFGLDQNGMLSYVNRLGKFDDIMNPATLGFEGREKLGSARGYIWSRTLPLILEKPLFGYGIDTFAIVFPQNDYVGKYNAYGTTNMVVDKAHNLILQIGINSGIFAVVSFLGLYTLIFYRSGKALLINSFKYDSAITSGLSLALLSYLIAAMFNDSTVHVSPVFWVMFGMLFSNLSSVKEKNT